MQEKEAKKCIEQISSYLEDPEGLCKEDWKNLRPKLMRACCFVDEELRDIGRETLKFFNSRFSDHPLMRHTGQKS